MARKPRNYQAEYARRIERGLRAGKSRKEARGHPSVARAINLSDTRLARARELEAQGLSRTRAAKEAHISTERYAASYKRGFVPRKHFTLMVKDKGLVTLALDGANAHDASMYLHAVKEVKATKDTSPLEPFDGLVIYDIGGDSYELETDYKKLADEDVVDDLKYTTTYN